MFGSSQPVPVSSIKDTSRLVFFIFLLATVIRFIHSYSNPTMPNIIDAADFDIIAYNLSIGNGFGYGQENLTSWRAPGYPYFLALIYSQFGHNYWAAWFFESIVGGLLPVLVFATAKYYFNPAVGLSSALICVIHPKLISYVNIGLAENLFSTFIMLMVLALTMSLRTQRFYMYFISGLVSGFTVLIKAIFLPFILFLVPCSMFLTPSLRPRLKLYTWTILGTLLVLTPWLIRNYQLHGQVVLVNTNGGFTLWYNNNNLSKSGYYWGATAQKGKQEKINKMIKEREEKINSPETLVEVLTPVVQKHYWKVLENVGTEELRKEFANLTEVQADRLFFKKAFTHIASHKVRFIKKSFRSAIKFFHVFDEAARYQWLWGLVLPFSLVGLFLSLKNWRIYLIFYCLIFNLWVVSTIFESSVRYRVPAEPFFIMFAIHGIIVLFKLRRNVFFYTLATVILINLPGIVYPDELRQFIRLLIKSAGLPVIPW